MDTIQHCWLDGTKKANTPSSSPLGVMLKYNNPLLMVRLLHTQKSAQPSSVSACLSRYFFSWVSRCSAGVSFQDFNHLIHVANAASPSCASCQSTTCMGASFTACALASSARHTCSYIKDSLAFTSPQSAAPIMVPSSSDQTITWSCLMGTQLKALAAQLSTPF